MNFHNNNKFTQHQPKRRDTGRNSIPLGLGGLMSSALRRHGIHNQVNSAMVVQSAQMSLERAVEPHIVEDVRVVSYRAKTIFIACRYAEAANALKPYLDGLKADLIREYPSLQIDAVDCRYRPHAFQERGY